MANLSAPAQDSVAAQREMFRLAASEFGLSIRALSKKTPIGFSTLNGWKAGAAMPAWALGALGEAGVPDHLLSMILEPFARYVGTDEDAEGDLDTAALEAGEFQSAVQRARHPKSPGGVAIVPQELAEIHQKRRIAQAAMRVAA